MDRKFNMDGQDEQDGEGIRRGEPLIGTNKR